jgi:hypothetical protein
MLLHEKITLQEIRMNDEACCGVLQWCFNLDYYGKKDLALTAV